MKPQLAVLKWIQVIYLEFEVSAQSFSKLLVHIDGQTNNFSFDSWIQKSRLRVSKRLVHIDGQTNHFFFNSWIQRFKLSTLNCRYYRFHFETNIVVLSLCAIQQFNDNFRISPIWSKLDHKRSSSYYFTYIHTHDSSHPSLIFLESQTEYLLWENLGVEPLHQPPWIISSTLVQDF